MKLNSNLTKHSIKELWLQEQNSSSKDYEDAQMSNKSAEFDQTV